MILSSIVKSLLHFGGALPLSRMAAHPSRGIVLRYHSVASPSDRSDLYLDRGLTLPPEDFEKQIRFLLRRYEIVPLDDIVERLRRGKEPYRRSLAITFDDGYRNNYTRAFPILRRYNVPATFYLTTGCIDNKQVLWTARLRYMVFTSTEEELRLAPSETFSLNGSHGGAREQAFRTLVARMKNVPTPQRQEILATIADRLRVTDLSPLQQMMMSWEEVREMRRHGMAFGAHTVTHPNLPNASIKEAAWEVKTSREMVQGALGEGVFHFSYPNGRGSSHLTNSVKELVRQCGYRSAVTSFSGCVQSGDDLFALKRVGVYRKHDRMANLSWEIERNRWRSG